MSAPQIELDPIGVTLMAPETGFPPSASAERFLRQSVGNSKVFS